ncbi:MAG: LysE family transporter, partial [Candidatus Bathyarchaeia archaeon]
MDVISFFTMVVAISVSGTLAPGPLFFANIARGIDHGSKSGLYFSVGHSIVELPLILFLATGLISVSNQLLISVISGLFGGVSLVGFGILQIKGALKGDTNLELRGKEKVGSSLMLGVTLTGLNPFFILWWLTAGIKLIHEAIALASFLGVLYMFTSHVWMDYAWLVLTAHLAERGKNIIKSGVYRALVLSFSLILIY